MIDLWRCTILVKEAIGTGETVGLAQQNACEVLGVSEQDVTFEVIQMPSRKTLGLFGGKSAKVRARFEVSPAKIAAEYLSDILKAYGLKDFVVDIEEHDDGASLHVTGENAKIAIGRRGDTLDAIQYLVGLVANDVSDSYYRLTINIGDYRERRAKVLESLGKKLAFKVLRTGKPIILEPMTPYERKVIHLAIEKIDGVKSWSEGEGISRHLIVELSDDAPRKQTFKTYGNIDHRKLYENMHVPLYEKVESNTL